VRPGRAGRFAGALAALALAGCESAPRPLVAGTDACDFCRMTVSDIRFGAELQSGTGKLHTFDAIECLASFYLDAAGRDDVRGAWVTDFEGQRLVPADSALFLEGGSLKSPMGRSIVAFAPGTSPDELERRYGGRALTWSGVLDRLRSERLTPGAGRSGRDSGTAHDHGGPG